MESSDNIELQCNNCGEFNFASSTYCSFCGEILSKNYFDILGVSKHSDYKEIKKAYKKLSLMCHPDKTEHLSNDLKKLSAKKMLQLNEIWDTLKLTFRIFYLLISVLTRISFFNNFNFNISSPSTEFPPPIT